MKYLAHALIYTASAGLTVFALMHDHLWLAILMAISMFLIILI